MLCDCNKELRLSKIQNVINLNIKLKGLNVGDRQWRYRWRPRVKMAKLSSQAFTVVLNASQAFNVVFF